MAAYLRMTPHLEIRRYLEMVLAILGMAKYLRKAGMVGYPEMGCVNLMICNHPRIANVFAGTGCAAPNG